MKKVFLILGMVGGLSVNNANATQSQALVNYICPDGCELHFSYTGSSVHASCAKPSGEACADPEVVISSIAPNVNQPMSEINKVNAKKSKKVSARSAETPRMVKKIVYEQIVEEDEE